MLVYNISYSQAEEEKTIYIRISEKVRVKTR